MNAWKRPWVWTGLLAALTLSQGGCGTFDNITIVGGNFFPTAPSAPGSNGSTTFPIITPARPPVVAPILVR